MKLSAEIFVQQKKFSGYFDRYFVIDSVAHSFVELVYMIERGPDIRSKIENGLAKLNSHRKGTEYVNTRDIPVTANFHWLYKLVSTCTPRQDSANRYMPSFSMVFAFNMTECWNYLLSLVNQFLVNLWNMALFVQPFYKK